MFKFSISLILLSIFTVNTQAAFLPQETSTGVDGAFDLLSNDTLFSNISNIYNFTDFNIAEGATLNVNNSGAVYIYSEQSIIINGALTSSSSDIHLIAPTITLGSITAIGTTVVATGQVFVGSPTADSGNGATSGNAITIGAGIDLTGIIGTGIDLTSTIETGTLVLDPSLSLTGITPVNNIGAVTFVTNPSPVPLPGALWLMISGIISFGLLKRRPQKH